MEFRGFRSRHSLSFLILLLVSFLLSSCIKNSGLRARNIASSVGNLAGGKTKGSAAVPEGSNTGTVGSGAGASTQLVELSNFIDPFDGTYKKKLTIPKNFKGNLYLAGLNVASLNNRLIKVRFSFGREKQAISLNATLARAPGIVPNTSIQVLVIDMNQSPFTDMRLGYDLYDYNDYSNPATDVVTDPRDGGLYCRGLLLEDDPTYIQGSGTGCNGIVPPATLAVPTPAASVCKYSYAKITDATLQYPVVTTSSTTPPVSTTTMYDKIPTRPSLWPAGGSAPAAAVDLLSNMCLPDFDQASFLSIISPTYNLSTLPNGLLYSAPYRSINSAEWQLSGAAIVSPTGLYAGSATGFQSLLFPRAGKLNLSANVQYYGSISPFTSRSLMLSDSSGTTQYVDGCNLRVMNYDPSSNESIGSCNVTASVEIYYLNDANQEVSITKDSGVKLQLIRPSITDYQGKEVLASAFKTCSSSTTCGTNECCYNSRCWSKDLVTQCVDQLPVIGNQVIGASCKSDFECSSLCCNTSTGACAAHNPNGNPPIFCSKSPGQQCVTKDFCRQDYISTCQVTKTGLVTAGTNAPICTLRCVPVLTYGTCVGTGPSSACVPPVQPAIPSASDVAGCVGAVDPVTTPIPASN